MGTPAPISGIKPPLPLVLGANIADNWRLFKQKWDNYAILTNLNKQAKEYQVALLLHTLGDDALIVYNGFDLPGDLTCDKIIKLFDNYAIGETNESYERFVFNNRSQKENENFETFLTAIRTLIKTCNYCDTCLPSILRDRIVVGIRDTMTQNTLLKERKLTLDSAISIGKAAELAAAQSTILNPTSVNRVKDSVSLQSATSRKPARNSGSRPTAGPSSYRKQPSTARECKFCGQCHVLKKECCPAWGKQCQHCAGNNHFAKKCPQKRRVHQVVEDDYSHQVVEDEYSSADETEWINSVKSTLHSREIKCNMVVAGQTVTFQVDTGATVNLLPDKYADNLNATTKKLTMWNGSEIPAVGTCRTTVLNPKTQKKYSVEFTVVKENLRPLLSYKTAEQMRLITLHEKNIERVLGVSDTLMAEYQDLFDGRLGTLP